MLLEFKVKNFKSFADEAIFSMFPAPKQKGLDYSIWNQKVKGKNVKGLCSSVIYGANASGKTNIIGAMDVFRSIILHGNIKNKSELESPNTALVALELIPNNNYSSPQPVEFSICFYEHNFLIEYEFSADLGAFLDVSYSRKILHEKLVVNHEIIFQRTDNTVVVGACKEIKKYISDSKKSSMENMNKIANSSLIPEELFLTNGFKIIFSQAFVKLFLDWIDSKFMVIYRADSMQYIRRFSDPQEKGVYIIDETTDTAAKIFGVNSNEIGYLVDDENAKPRLCSTVNGTVMPSEIFESYGTLRFINLFPIVIRTILIGGTLIVDEFDASIHPMALMNIINIFHNDEINIHHAQLIFNTHNPIFLNPNLFRRDEIKFVERDDETHTSELYSLSDFGTDGKSGVRQSEDYMKNYFVSRYGAIKEVDFTPIFEKAIHKFNKEEKENESQES